MEEERKEMPFGKKFRAGNFEYLKIVKTLSKRELNALRDAAKIPVDVRKHLSRGGLPYMVVNTISGSWSVCFVCGSLMYALIEQDNLRGEEGEKALATLFMMMYSDTAVMGDQQYWEDKGKAFKAFLERQKAPKDDIDKDNEELEALRTEAEAREAILGMTKEVENEE